MADDEKQVAPDVAPVDSYAAAQNEFHDRPAGWIYKGHKIFGREIYYASPRVQLVLVALVCFLCPGMYNSLTGLGGGGQVDPTAQDHSSVALYSTFAVVGFFSGTFANRLGLRLTLGFGGLGYCIYSASFLSYNHNKNIGFVIFAGAFLGVCAGLLWTAQGAVMMSYPPEDKKGRYIATFWIIFNLGAVIGSLVRPLFFSLSPLYLEIWQLLDTNFAFVDSSCSEHPQPQWNCRRWHLRCFHRPHVPRLGPLLLPA